MYKMKELAWARIQLQIGVLWQTKSRRTSYLKTLRSKKKEEESLKVARYLGGLKWNIQEELSLWAPTTIQRCHQLALKVEEKNKRKGDSNFKDRGKGRNQKNQRGGYQGKGSDQKSQSESKPMEQPIDHSSRGGYNRGRGNQGGSSRGRGGRSSSYFATMKCYNCGQLGHPAYRCPDNPLPQAKIKGSHMHKKIIQVTRMLT